jgi:hypothetical protein
MVFVSRFHDDPRSWRRFYEGSSESYSGEKIVVQELRHSPARDTSCENEALLCAAEVAVHDKRKGRKT